MGVELPSAEARHRRAWLRRAMALGMLAAAPARSTLARTSENASPVEVTHALGRTVVAQPALRVITLFQGATDTAVGLGVRPAGVVESWTDKPVYPYLRTALADVPQVGLETQPSLEDVISLAPDLIVGSRFRNERIYTLLNQIAPTIVLDNVYDYRATLAMMGQALGRTDDAQRLADRWDERLTRVRTRLQARFGHQWPLTVSVIEFREDHVRAYLPDSFSGGVLTPLGFTRTTEQRSTGQPLTKITSREAIPYLDAQIMFVLTRSGRPAVIENMRRWQSHPLWARLQAPQAGRVYEVDNVVWSLSGGILGANLMLDDIEQRLGLQA